MASDSEQAAFDDDWEEWNPEATSFLTHTIAGSCAGVMEHVGMFPVDTYKTHLQARRATGERRLGFGRFMAKHGLVRLWRGAPVMMVGCIPSHAAYFSVYERAKIAFGVNKPGHSPLAAAACGAMATTLHDAVLTPLDVVKQRLQLGFYDGVTDCVRTIIKQEGVGALFRSYPTTLLMNWPYASVLVATNETIKETMRQARGPGHKAGKDDPLSGAEFLLSGALAGAVAAAVTTPLDVLKTRGASSGVARRFAMGFGARGCARLGAGAYPVLPGTGSAGSKARVWGPRASAARRTGASIATAFRADWTLHTPSPPPDDLSSRASATSERDVATARAQRPRVALRMPAGVPGIADLHLVRGSAPQYTGLVDAARKVVGAEGVRGLFRGMGARMAVHAPSAAISWGTYEALKNALRPITG
ncbi:hypothetical protein FNF27_04466 [Cafeteria roenbergensis]|uniref:Mitochondrial carrier protein n=1 Tax=Cafeteria roenbergensis TaxID=33653 RepID=A0A5A8C659_CAFRO|nr:hypothetical protein FNF28_07486 [Cafeteria roenbergensis]KAA0150878.1 hypothetical protein FNF29_04992 [Cafeteria roenbergensis]KAA0154808.1 hypothetical protein FNF31_06227 [Cafeteria roenbergensis]KAA0174080.1 hypothetical protein FNF27_04466 [Cafeteria roenbergensis]|eukprot:KAA0150878.1 hypothetical protein FNF29_04992 [Cafeteria roenbergensis]